MNVDVLKLGSQWFQSTWSILEGLVNFVGWVCETESDTSVSAEGCVSVNVGGSGVCNLMLNNAVQ